MQTVVETRSYLADAKDAGMDDEDRALVVDALASNPEAGDVIKGSNGVRKLRVARPGGGKSGGWRVLTGFVGHDSPVYLIAAYAKNDRANMSKAGINVLAKLMEALKAAARDGERT